MAVESPTVQTAEDRPYDPFTPPQRDSPHEAWAAARESGPVFHSAALDAWVVASDAGVRQVLGDPETFRNAGATAPVRAVPPQVQAVLDRGIPGDRMRTTVSLDGATHARLRRFLVTVVNPRRVRSLNARTRELTIELLDCIRSRGRAEFVSEFAFRLPLLMLTELLDIPGEDADRLHRWSSDKLALQWGRLDLADHVAAAEGFVDFQRYIGAILADRRRSPREDDILTDFQQVRIEDERPLEDDEIVGVVMGLVAAGHETTTNLISLTLLHALERVDLWPRVCADPSLVPALVEESLRFDSPAHSIWRRCVADAEVEGVRIPAGSRVSVVLGSANRDRHQWTAPDEFDLARPALNQALAFGRGLHFCVGAPLARMEAVVVFDELARTLPSLRLAPGFVPEFRPNAVQRFLTALEVEWDV